MRYCNKCNFIFYYTIMVVEMKNVGTENPVLTALEDAARKAAEQADAELALKVDVQILKTDFSALSSTIDDFGPQKQNIIKDILRNSDQKNINILQWDIRNGNRDLYLQILYHYAKECIDKKYDTKKIKITAQVFENIFDMNGKSANDELGLAGYNDWTKQLDPDWSPTEGTLLWRHEVIGNNGKKTYQDYIHLDGWYVSQINRNLLKSSLLDNLSTYISKPGYKEKSIEDRQNDLDLQAMLKEINDPNITKDILDDNDVTANISVINSVKGNINSQNTSLRAEMKSSDGLNRAAKRRWLGWFDKQDNRLVFDQKTMKFKEKEYKIYYCADIKLDINKDPKNKA
jgi:hypothetical protein